MRFSILCALLILLEAGCECKSSNIDLIVRFGDSLYAQKQYKNALLEYQVHSFLWRTESNLEPE
jgi:hypothetical protein